MQPAHDVPPDHLAVIAELSTKDWDFTDLPADDTVHALHPYPAKFIPQIPRRLIDSLSRPGELVIDPFSGGGTTAVEALAAGRKFHGVDANPLAILLGQVKTTVLGLGATAACKEVAFRVLAEGPAVIRQTQKEDWRPTIPNLEKWYTLDVFELLVGLRRRVMSIGDGNARALALMIFANVAARASHQESETRYVSKPRFVEPSMVLAQFVKDLQRAVRLVSQLRHPDGAFATFAEGDARDSSLYPSGVALAVTSPPYPNSFDYHLYHRFRLFWLGPGPLGLRSMEIGSHLKHQSEPDPAASYSRDMARVLSNVRDALIPGGHLALVVGDGIYKGVAFETSVRLSEIAVKIGYEVASVVTRQLPSHRRSVTNAARRLQQEQILILRRPTTISFAPPNYGLFAYEKVLSEREVGVLTGHLRSRLGDSAGERKTLVRAAFSHAVFEGSAEAPTSQRLLEGPSSSSRKKNSTYVTHGLHRYKGKFYPQLAKALLNLSGIAREDRVIDPFGGSGTVALEANLIGAAALSLDCNPVAVSVARAKTDVLHIERRSLRSYLESLLAACTPRTVPAGAELTEFSPATFPELERWIPVPVLVKLNRLLSAVRTHDDTRLVNLGEVLVSDVVREVSQQEPTDLRIRRRSHPIEDAPVYEAFASRVQSLLLRLDAYWDGARDRIPEPGHTAVVLGDSADASCFPDLDAQAVVSSPPYAAALPYIDTDRLSLAAVYGLSAYDRKALETTMIGSREITTRERRGIESVLTDNPDDLTLPESTLAFLISYLEAVRNDDNAGFRRQQAPAVLARYFQAMSLVLGNVVECLDAGSDVWLVLGDSRSVIGGRSWRIPTVDEVYAIGKYRGLEMVEAIPITVTRENVAHAKNAIVENQIIHLRT